MEAGSTSEEMQESLAMVPVGTPAFMQAQSPVGTVQTSSPWTGLSQSGNREPSRAWTLMPVNIKQIADAWMSTKQNHLIINNTVASTVKVIGKVIGKHTDEYKGTFKIEDCTGTIQASIWFTLGSKELDCISEGAYAMVAGSVKLDGTTPEIQCYVCRAVTNFNDITHHHLSAIAAHIDLVLKPAVRHDSQISSHAGQAKTVHDRVSELWGEDMLGGSDSPANQNQPIKPVRTRKPSYLFTTRLTNTSSTGIEIAQGKIQIEEQSTIGLPTSDAIMHILREESAKLGPTGVHIDTLCTKLMTDKDSIRPYLDDLAKVGEIYTTVDRDHYVPT